MTPRRRFHETMAFGCPDRVPLWDEGLRDDVLTRWYAEGLPADTDPATLFEVDRRERIDVNLDPTPASPLLKDRDAVRVWRERLDAEDRSRLPDDWAGRLRRWRGRDHVLELPIHRGLFRTMEVGCWADIEPVIYLLADRPAFVREIMDEYASFAAKVAERILQDVDVDFVSFSEPVGSNHAPIISPALYKDVVLDSYAPVIEVLQRHGVRWIVFVTYANARALLRDVIDAGFNVLWAVETESTAMDYGSIRREYGRDLRLIGGIDLDVLMGDEAAIRHELVTKVPPLLADGGYIPLADGRVRSSVPFRNYEYYRRMLQHLVEA
ncbi:MAG: hypothetical protein O2923_02775 [Verrucomicrobia bacterium]|nr:hypothetical protein [Verrucomicrobiota bacterium]MDA1086573.1 hypothetical protein [Verrucomicrobiota bacterium]